MPSHKAYLAVDALELLHCRRGDDGLLGGEVHAGQSQLLRADDALGAHPLRHPKQSGVSGHSDSLTYLVILVWSAWTTASRWASSCSASLQARAIASSSVFGMI